MPEIMSTDSTPNLLESIRDILVHTGGIEEAMAEDTGSQTAMARERTALTREQTRLSTKSTELANIRTDLGRERTLLADQRTTLAVRRTEMARHRTALRGQLRKEPPWRGS